MSDIYWASCQGHLPILNDLIDDLDLLRYRLGEVVEISGVTTSLLRGSSVRSSLGCLLKFENDVICTVNVSDEVVSQANWFLTAGETDKYSRTGQSCLWIGGYEGTLSIPDMAFWSYGDTEASWESRLQVEKINSDSRVSAVIAVLLDFECVIHDKKVPVYSGEDALISMRLIETLYDRLS